MTGSKKLVFELKTFERREYNDPSSDPENKT